MSTSMTPNGPGFHYSLYQSAQPSCGYWLDIYNQYPSKIPSEVMDKTGRLHLVRPTYWNHGIQIRTPFSAILILASSSPCSRIVSLIHILISKLSNIIDIFKSIQLVSFVTDDFSYIHPHWLKYLKIIHIT